MNWISLKDRQPPTDEPVLYARFDEKNEKYFVGLAWYMGSGCLVPITPEAARQVTHWMPLPSPPGCGVERLGD